MRKKKKRTKQNVICSSECMISPPLLTFSLKGLHQNADAVRRTTYSQNLAQAGASSATPRPVSATPRRALVRTLSPAAAAIAATPARGCAADTSSTPSADPAVLHTHGPAEFCRKPRPGRAAAAAGTPYENSSAEKPEAVARGFATSAATSKPAASPPCRLVHSRATHRVLPAGSGRFAALQRATAVLYRCCSAASATGSHRARTTHDAFRGFFFVHYLQVFSPTLPETATE